MYMFEAAHAFEFITRFSKYDAINSVTPYVVLTRSILLM